jgi:small conductance mechanosensitive channel
MKKSLNQFLKKYDLGSLNDWVDVLVNIIEITVIIIVAWVILSVIHRIILRIESKMILSTSIEDKKRVHTLSRVFRYIASLIVIASSIILILAELGVSVAPLLATAGVAGIAIGFGAQTLVKDYFTGFVMLIENQIRQDDIVEIAGKAGTVEEVTLRYVRLRDYEGAVHFVPNSSISVVTNRTRTFAYAVTDIGVAYKEDLDRVYEVMREVAKQMRADPALNDQILGELEIAGVEGLGDSAIMIRSRLMVKAQDQALIRRELQERIKKAFDLHKIEIPYKHLVIKNPE